MSRPRDVTNGGPASGLTPVGGRPATPVARRSDSQTPIAWDVLVSAARYYASENGYSDQLAGLVADIIPSVLHSKDFGKYFRSWESTGFHVTPVHFYSPIPNTAALSADIWAKETAMAGIDMNDAGQLRLLEAFKRFQSEYNALPRDPTNTPERFYLNNPMFAGTDALVLYGVVRHFQPHSVVEVGGGFSTRLLVEAARRNGPTDICCIEPWPDAILKQRSLPVTLIEQRVQDVSLSLFERLDAGDILFIDSSHVLTIGGDVSHLFLEILPRLKPGVIVHVHDIFLPRQQPKEWVLDQQRFWCEQDVLQAFLAFNGAFEVLLSNAYLGLRYQQALRDTFPRSEWWGGGSFWIRRVRSA